MTRFLIILQIYLAALTHGIRPEIATAVCFVESSFRPAVTNGQCVGLMQVNVPVWRKQLNLDPKRMTEVAYNLKAGMTILRHYYDQTGSIEKALYLYNNGYKGKNNKYVPQVRAGYKMLFNKEML